MTTPAFVFTQQVNGTTVLEVKVFAEATTQGGQEGLLFTFATTLADGYRVDLNGFFLDTGAEGGGLTQVNGANANNMRGGNNDGYDYAIGLGTIGGNDTDFTSGSRFVAGLTLDDLVGADAGLRATSYGLDAAGSLKLVADYTPPPPPPGDDFPPWAQDISNVILVFDTTEGDSKPNPDGDGYYTVKIDDWPSAANDDLDASIADILAWLEANDPVFQGGATNEAQSLLLGAIIKGGTQDTNFYAYGDDNTNGTAADTPPDGLGLSWTGSENPQPASAVDTSYAYDLVFG